MTPEERKEKQRAYYRAHRDHYRELRRNWVANNHEYWLERQQVYQKQYRAEHPEKWALYRERSHINALKKLGYTILKDGAEV